MRLVWVPQWTVLPVIVEDRAMGDENAERPRLASNAPGMDTVSGGRLGKHDTPMSCKLQSALDDDFARSF